MTDRPGHEPEEQEELVAADDAVIGTAFRWSLVVIALLAVVVAAVVLLRGGGDEPVEAVPAEVVPVADLDQRVETMPVVSFTDVARAGGVTFDHESAARGEKLLPETMGSGVAFLDYDGDGDQDLLFANATPWPGDAADPTTPALYRNDGTGRFDDVTELAGLGDLHLFGTGIAAADYDGDGDPDLYLTALGGNRLLRNDTGWFVDVTKTAGVAGGPTDWSTSAGFFDYDNDGDLDLFVCNYVRWSREIDIEIDFSMNGRDRAYGPPTDYAGAHPFVFRNDGDGRFSDVSAEAGIEVLNPTTGDPMAKALALTFVDIDRDGWLDVFVANDTVQNFLFRNRGDGTFEEIGALAGVGFDAAGNATGAMGIDAAHHRNDTQLAVGIGNFANEMSSLYVSSAGVGSGTVLFTDEAAGEGVGAPSRSFLSFGLFFFDYDLDGRLDLLQTNGHLEEEIHQVQASQQYRQPAQLFWNRGPDARSCYSEVPADTVGDLAREIVGRGAAYADMDRDGDLDVVLTQTGGPPLLLRNDQALGHHWLRVKLVGRDGNTDAIGAWVELEADGVVQRRQVMPTRSYLSQVELPLTFGLGTAERVDRLQVEWPDGTTVHLDGSGVDKTVVFSR